MVYIGNDTERGGHAFLQVTLIINFFKGLEISIFAQSDVQ